MDTQDSQNTQKPNTPVELAKPKADAQKKGKSFGFFGESKSSRFARPVHSSRPATRGGRNGQGKP